MAVLKGGWESCQGMVGHQVWRMRISQEMFKEIPGKIKGSLFFKQRHKRVKCGLNLLKNIEIFILVSAQ